ncbi:MAG: hypothetical protein IPK02_22860 [Candidatus Accumulibacter sp.]|uniref:Transposase DDE domain-containing protein n=1 Tax=Candidatus Accumulibacter affinis TaxID=2954384 RepID=A0A935TBE7_9PROT|nr:hypothetical protein [Candidatus Accumulibacter affinis]
MPSVTLRYIQPVVRQAFVLGMLIHPKLKARITPILLKQLKQIITACKRLYLKRTVKFLDRTALAARVAAWAAAVA